MSVKTSDDSLEPVTSLAITGTLRLRTRTVITVANMPSVRASSLPLPRPGMLDWSTVISSTRVHKAIIESKRPTRTGGCYPSFCQKRRQLEVCFSQVNAKCKKHLISKIGFREMFLNQEPQIAILLPQLVR